MYELEDIDNILSELSDPNEKTGSFMAESMKLSLKEKRFEASSIDDLINLPGYPSTSKVNTTKGSIVPKNNKQASSSKKADHTANEDINNASLSNLHGSFSNETRSVTPESSSNDSSNDSVKETSNVRIPKINILTKEQYLEQFRRQDDRKIIRKAKLKNSTPIYHNTRYRKILPKQGTRNQTQFPSRKIRVLRRKQYLRKRLRKRIFGKLKDTLKYLENNLNTSWALLLVNPLEDNGKFHISGSTQLVDIIEKKHKDKIIREVRKCMLGKQFRYCKKILPPLTRNGKLVSLNQLPYNYKRMIIPHMIRKVNGSVTPNWNKKEMMPPWWPADVPWANVNKDSRTAEEKAKMRWTLVLNKIIKACYTYYNCEDLLNLHLDKKESSRSQASSSSPRDVSATNSPISINSNTDQNINLPEELSFKSSSQNTRVSNNYDSKASPQDVPATNSAISINSNTDQTINSTQELSYKSSSQNTIVSNNYDSKASNSSSNEVAESYCNSNTSMDKPDINTPIPLFDNEGKINSQYFQIDYKNHGNLEFEEFLDIDENDPQTIFPCSSIKSTSPQDSFEEELNAMLTLENIKNKRIRSANSIKDPPISFDDVFNEILHHSEGSDSDMHCATESQLSSTKQSSQEDKTKEIIELQAIDTIKEVLDDIISENESNIPKPLTDKQVDEFLSLDTPKNILLFLDEDNSSIKNTENCSTNEDFSGIDFLSPLDICLSNIDKQSSVDNVKSKTRKSRLRDMSSYPPYIPSNYNLVNINPKNTSILNKESTQHKENEPSTNIEENTALTNNNRKLKISKAKTKNKNRNQKNKNKKNTTPVKDNIAINFSSVHMSDILVKSNNINDISEPPSKENLTDIQENLPCVSNKENYVLVTDQKNNLNYSLNINKPEKENNNILIKVSTVNSSCENKENKPCLNSKENNILQENNCLKNSVIPSNDIDDLKYLSYQNFTSNNKEDDVILKNYSHDVDQCKNITNTSIINEEKNITSSGPKSSNAILPSLDTISLEDNDNTNINNGLDKNVQVEKPEKKTEKRPIFTILDNQIIKKDHSSLPPRINNVDSTEYSAKSNECIIPKINISVETEDKSKRRYFKSVTTINKLEDIKLTVPRNNSKSSEEININIIVNESVNSVSNNNEPTNLNNENISVTADIIEEEGTILNAKKKTKPRKKRNLITKKANNFAKSKTILDNCKMSNTSIDNKESINTLNNELKASSQNKNNFLTSNTLKKIKNLENTVQDSDYSVNTASLPCENMEVTSQNRKDNLVKGSDSSNTNISSQIFENPEKQPLQNDNIVSNNDSLLSKTSEACSTSKRLENTTELTDICLPVCQNLEVENLQNSNVSNMDSLNKLASDLEEYISSINISSPLIKNIADQSIENSIKIFEQHLVPILLKKYLENVKISSTKIKSLIPELEQNVIKTCSLKDNIPVASKSPEDSEKNIEDNSQNPNSATDMSSPVKNIMSLESKQSNNKTNEDVLTAQELEKSFMVKNVSENSSLLSSNTSLILDDAESETSSQNNNVPDKDNVGASKEDYDRKLCELSEKYFGESCPSIHNKTNENSTLSPDKKTPLFKNIKADDLPNNNSLGSQILNKTVSYNLTDISSKENNKVETIQKSSILKDLVEYKNQSSFSIEDGIMLELPKENTNTECSKESKDSCNTLDNNAVNSAELPATNYPNEQKQSPLHIIPSKEIFNLPKQELNTVEVNTQNRNTLPVVEQGLKKRIRKKSKVLVPKRDQNLLKNTESLTSKKSNKICSNKVSKKPRKSNVVKQGLPNIVKKKIPTKNIPNYKITANILKSNNETQNSTENNLFGSTENPQTSNACTNSINSSNNQVGFTTDLSQVTSSSLQSKNVAVSPLKTDKPTQNSTDKSLYNISSNISIDKNTNIRKKSSKRKLNFGEKSKSLVSILKSSYEASNITGLKKPEKNDNGKFVPLILRRRTKKKISPKNTIVSNITKSTSRLRSKKLTQAESLNSEESSKTSEHIDNNINPSSNEPPATKNKPEGLEKSAENKLHCATDPIPSMLLLKIPDTYLTTSKPTKIQMGHGEKILDSSVFANMTNKRGFSHISLRKAEKRKLPESVKESTEVQVIYDSSPEKNENINATKTQIRTQSPINISSLNNIVAPSVSIDDNINNKLQSTETNSFAINTSSNTCSTLKDGEKTENNQLNKKKNKRDYSRINLDSAEKKKLLKTTTSESQTSTSESMKTDSSNEFSQFKHSQNSNKGAEDASQPTLNISDKLQKIKCNNCRKILCSPLGTNNKKSNNCNQSTLMTSQRNKEKLDSNFKVIDSQKFGKITIQPLCRQNMSEAIKSPIKPISLPKRNNNMEKKSVVITRSKRTESDTYDIVSIKPFCGQSINKEKKTAIITRSQKIPKEEDKITIQPLCNQNSSESTTKSTKSSQLVKVKIPKEEDKITIQPLCNQISGESTTKSTKSSQLVKVKITPVKSKDKEKITNQLDSNQNRINNTVDTTKTSNKLTNSQDNNNATSSINKSEITNESSDTSSQQAEKTKRVCIIKKKSVNESTNNSKRKKGQSDKNKKKRCLSNTQK